MKHDERCEFKRPGWRYCHCAERAYLSTATDEEQRIWLDATGHEIADFYR